MQPSAGDVLIVEDTPASLQLLSDLLTHAGYSARRARDGKIALLSAQAQPPDLILLDVRMPDIDGYEVCRRLKADVRTRDVPVIFLSALRETEDKVLAFQLGAADYISKPFQPDEVLARVHTHVELRRLRVGLEDRVRERTAQFLAADQQLRESQAQLEKLAGFLQSVREEERTRIARELHDELGQALTVLRIDLNWLRNKCCSMEPGIVDKLASAYTLVERTVDALRRISEDLRPAMLDDLGLAAALEHHVDTFAERTGIDCHLAMNREEFELDERVATTIFRLVQESLTNVARHADADRLSVDIEETPEGMRVVIADNGRGFAAAPGTNAFGLIGMRERARMLGGRVEVTSMPGAGTRVEAWLPRVAEAGR